MKRAKIAVSIPAPLVARARRAVERGRAASVSAYVTTALQQQGKLDDLDELLREMLQETGGPLSRGERRSADRVLDGVVRPRRRVA